MHIFLAGKEKIMALIIGQQLCLLKFWVYTLMSILGLTFSSTFLMGDISLGCKNMKWYQVVLTFYDLFLPFPVECLRLMVWDNIFYYDSRESPEDSLRRKKSMT